MAIRDRIRRWMFGGTDPLSGGSERWWRPSGEWTKTAAGIDVSPGSAVRVSAVYACVRVLAETMAQLPVHVYERMPNGRRRMADQHPLNQLFLAPNGWQTWFEFVEFQMGNLGLRGNAYAERVSGSLGTASLLRPLRADRMQVERLENGKLRYTYADPATFKKTTYMQDEIFHVRGPMANSEDLVAPSPITAARESIGLAVATEAHGSTFFGNGARPGFAFVTEQPIKADAAQTVLDGWNAVHGGAFKAHKPAILPFGLKPAMIGMTNEDSQFLDTRRFQVEEIARIYRVPLHLIGDLTRATFSNIEHQALEFVQYTMLPWIRRWEQAIARDLLAEPERFYVKFNVDGLLRGDSAARSAFLREMVNSGIYDLNTALEKEDLDPIGPLGEVRLVQGAMTTLDRVVNPPEPPTPVVPDESEPNAEDELRMERVKRVELEIDAAKFEASFELSKVKYGEECAETKRLLGELATAMQVKAEAEQEATDAKAQAEAEQKQKMEYVAKAANLEQEEISLREKNRHAAEQLDAAVSMTVELVKDGMQRMQAMEADGVKRALSKPNFLAAIDDFYADHESRLAAVLEGPLRLHSTLCGAGVRPAFIAQEHVEESKRRLLEAAEVTAEELPESVSTCLDAWGDRPNKIAEQVLAYYPKE